MCWTAHIVLCALGQGKYLSARPDILKAQTEESGAHQRAA